VKTLQRRAEWKGLTIYKQESPNPDETFINFAAAWIDKATDATKVMSRDEDSHFVRDKQRTWWYMGSKLPEKPEEQPAGFAGFQMPKINLGF